MSSFKGTINIAVVFDINFKSAFYVLATSIFKNNKSSLVHFHAITPGLDCSSKKELASYVQQQKGKMFFYELTDEQAGNLVMPQAEARYSIINFYRLFFPFLVPKSVTRLLYLDTDTLVLSDLSELFRMDLDGNPFGAVVDPGTEIRNELGITKPRQYFNAGVLIMDMKIWRQKAVTERAFLYLNQYPEKCKYLDQDILNAVSIGNWKVLDMRFNLMEQYVPNLVRKQYDEFLKNVVVVHFNRLKPWNRLCAAKLRFLFYQYFEKSPVAHKPLFHKMVWTPKNLYWFLRFRLQSNYLYLYVQQCFLNLT